MHEGCRILEDACEGPASDCRAFRFRSSPSGRGKRFRFQLVSSAYSSFSPLHSSPHGATCTPNEIPVPTELSECNEGTFIVGTRIPLHMLDREWRDWESTAYPAEEQRDSHSDLQFSFTPFANMCRNRRRLSLPARTTELSDSNMLFGRAGFQLSYEAVCKCSPSAAGFHKFASVFAQNPTTPRSPIDRCQY